MVAPNAPGVNQWPGPPPKDMGMPVGGVAKPTGWEEPSPPAQRRNIPNYDDGTSLWGGQQRAAVQGNKVSVGSNRDSVCNCICLSLSLIHI